MSFHIIGAGMAGLLAGALLRHECAEIWERQSQIPNNHSALLRFRTSIVGDVLNIPFRRVQVLKAVLPFRNPVADAIAYSWKTNGSYSTSRSIVGVRDELLERFIAPTDLIEQMRQRVSADIKLNYQIEGFHSNDPIISTIPMPALMDMLDYPHAKEIAFESRKGINITADVVGMDAYGTVYVPNSHSPISRISAVGNRLIVECYSQLSNVEESYTRLINWAAQQIGVDSFHIDNVNLTKQQYAKIQPIDEDARKRFILWASEEHNVYSLGRFATWRPGLLLDDLVNDLRVIQRLTGGGSSYEHRK